MKRALSLRVLMLVAFISWVRCNTSERDAEGMAERRLSGPFRTTVCEISANPKRFYDMRVTVEGCIRTDGLEHTVLYDKKCPHTGIGPLESGKLPAAKRLFPEVGREVCGTFTGTFRAATMIDTNVLEIEDAANVKILEFQRDIVSSGGSSPR